jgi:hypothetical protein
MSPGLWDLSHAFSSVLWDLSPLAGHHNKSTPNQTLHGRESMRKGGRNNKGEEKDWFGFHHVENKCGHI